MMAPAGAEFFTHGGDDKVVEEITVLDDELEVFVGAADDVEIVEGAALLGRLDVLVGDGVEEITTEDDVEVIEAAVLMQEQALEIFEGKLEQAGTQVGSATELVAKVYVEQNGAAIAEEPIKALLYSSSASSLNPASEIYQAIVMIAIPSLQLRTRPHPSNQNGKGSHELYDCFV
jgi:hypothetical protein